MVPSYILATSRSPCSCVLVGAYQTRQAGRIHSKPYGEGIRVFLVRFSSEEVSFIKPPKRKQYTIINREFSLYV